MQPRFIYYLLLVNLFANGIGYVPRILLESRHHGVFVAVALAWLVGWAITTASAMLFKRIPNTDMPSLWQSAFPKPLAGIIIVVFAAEWLIAGTLNLFLVAEISSKYLNIGTPGTDIILLFILLTLFAAHIETPKALFALELSLIISFPLVVLALLAALTQQGLLWESVFRLLREVRVPRWLDVSAASYVYAGYLNLAWFNRIVTSDYPIRWMSIATAGVGVLYMLFFALPIALLGSEAVALYHYPWINAANALRIEHAPLERAFYPVLIGYLNIAVLNTIVHWHVFLNFLRSLSPKQPTQRRASSEKGSIGERLRSAFGRHWPSGVLSAYAFLVVPGVFREWPMELIYQTSRLWFAQLIPAELFALGLGAWAVVRRDRSSGTKRRRRSTGA